MPRNPATDSDDLPCMRSSESEAADGSPEDEETAGSASSQGSVTVGKAASFHRDLWVALAGAITGGVLTILAALIFQDREFDEIRQAESRDKRAAAYFELIESVEEFGPIMNELDECIKKGQLGRPGPNELSRVNEHCSSRAIETGVAQLRAFENAVNRVRVYGTTTATDIAEAIQNAMPARYTLRHTVPQQTIRGREIFYLKYEEFRTLARTELPAKPQPQ